MTRKNATPLNTAASTPRIVIAGQERRAGARSHRPSSTARRSHSVTQAAGIATPYRPPIHDCDEQIVGKRAANAGQRADRETLRDPARIQTQYGADSSQEHRTVNDAGQHGVTLT